jgi:hypothetical protein
MNEQAGINGFFPSVSACHFSFFDIPELAQAQPIRYFYDKHVREIDAVLSLAILNPTFYNPHHIDIHPVRNRQFTKGQSSPFGARQVSYSHSKNRFRGAYYPIRQVRQARENERLKDKLKPILYRINSLCHKQKLTIEEGRELEELRVKLSPSYKVKKAQADIQLKREFEQMISKAGNNLKGEIAELARGTISINASATTTNQ